MAMPVPSQDAASGAQYNRSPGRRNLARAGGPLHTRGNAVCARSGFGAKLRAVFGLSPTILCLTGLEDGRVRDVNDSFLHTTGFTRERSSAGPWPSSASG